jgi:hypothetical protein
MGYDFNMPDGLYERDILSWSEHQADLLRRLARGERVNDVDWQHVVEEIEDVGLSELNAVRSYLRLMLVHLLKIQGWPNSPSIDHWRGEAVSFQADAEQRFSPSMRQRIDLAALYDKAVAQIGSARFDGVAPRAWAAECPFSLDELLRESPQGSLEPRLTAASKPGDL